MSDEERAEIEARMNALSRQHLNKLARDMGLTGGVLRTYGKGKFYDTEDEMIEDITGHPRPSAPNED